MTHDRITELRIEGLRVFDKTRVRLDGLTVLIGDNGSGKSTLIEACELLRRLAGPQFVGDLYSVHGGLRALLRPGAKALRLGVRIEGAGPALDYSLVLTADGEQDMGIAERLMPAAEPKRAILDRVRGKGHVEGVAEPFGLTRHDVMLTHFGMAPPRPEIARMVRALAGIEVHLPFDVLPAWAAKASERSSPMRQARTIQPVERLDRFAANLANAYAKLRNEFGEAHWSETMDYVRLGLGDAVESVNTRPDPGGSAIAVCVKYRSLDEQRPASALSDGVLAYLAFVALFRLPGGQSLIAFDEPELHLHPALLMRVLGMFETMAEDRAVLLATHSDRLLDGLEQPEAAAVLCELDSTGQTSRMRRPDASALAAFLDRYRGLGDVRAAGHERSVMTRDETSG